MTDRRDVLKRISWLTGISFASPLLNFYLTGCEGDQAYQNGAPLLFLEESQFEVLTAAVDRIIPTTTTPGAVEAGVPRYMDKVLKNVFAPAKAQRFREGLMDLQGYSRDVFNTDFAKLPLKEQDAYLESLQKASLEAKENPEQPSFFRMLQNLTLFGFFTSEIGATQALSYLPVPGSYKGCVSTQEYATTWAL